MSRGGHAVTDQNGIDSVDTNGEHEIIFSRINHSHGVDDEQKSNGHQACNYFERNASAGFFARPRKIIYRV